MKESWLYEKLKGRRVACNVCGLRCVIASGHRGACGTRLNDGGILYSAIAGGAAAWRTGSIETEELHHFHPGSKVLSIGASGCNFRCPGCRNGLISRAPGEGIGRSVIPIEPEEIAERALVLGCAGIAWSGSDPAIWIEQTVPGARRAKRLGLYGVYATNGYATEEHLEMIAPYLGAWRVDLKGFSSATYKRLSGVARFEPVLHMTKRAKRLGLHVECVTNLTPTINDDERELRALARWIRRELGEHTPWHVTRFFPSPGLAGLPPTPVAQLERACDVGREEGLKYVYLGNVPGHERGNTRCHGCGGLLIDRSGSNRGHPRLRRGRCPDCGVRIPGVWGMDPAPGGRVPVALPAEHRGSGAGSWHGGHPRPSNSAEESPFLGETPPPGGTRGAGGPVASGLL